MIKKPRPYGSIEQNSKVKNQGDQTLVKISQKISIEKAKLPLKSYTVIAKIHFISVPSGEVGNLHIKTKVGSLIRKDILMTTSNYTSEIRNKV